MKLLIYAKRKFNFQRFSNDVSTSFSGLNTLRFLGYFLVISSFFNSYFNSYFNIFDFKPCHLPRRALPVHHSIFSRCTARAGSPFKFSRCTRPAGYRALPRIGATAVHAADRHWRWQRGESADGSPFNFSRCAARQASAALNEAEML